MHGQNTMRRYTFILNKHSFLSATFLTLTLVLSTLALATPVPKDHPQYKEIMGVLHKNLTSLIAKDAPGVLDTLSTSCDAYEGTKKLLPQLFTTSIKFTLVSREILSISSQEALVQEVIEVKKTDSKQAFRDNRATTQSKLTKNSSGLWKLCSTEVKEVKYLDEHEKVDLSNPTAQKILKTLTNNYQAMVNEDLPRIMETISKRCDSYAATQKGLPGLFASYDLKYELVDRTVLSITQNKSRVRESVIVRKKTGSLPFKNNQTTSESELILEADGVWRVCTTKILGVKYLD